MLQQLVNGLILGSVYALLALGYTMVYGIIKLINFAHGDIYMVGAFMGYFLLNSLKVNFFVALLLAMVGTAILGVVIEYLAYRPLRHSTRIAALITAIGVSFLLEYGMVFFVGANTRSFPQVIKTVRYNFGPISISNIQLMILGVSVFLMVALQFIIQKTKMGKAMRAVSVDSDAAQLMGINVNRTISFTFALGSALAGAGGVLIGFVLQLDRAFDGDDTRDQSLCRSRSWRNRNHSRCGPRWICYRFVGNLRHSDRSLRFP